MWTLLIECFCELVLCASAPVYLIYSIFKRIHWSLVLVACASLLILLAMPHITASTSMKLLWQENRGLFLAAYRSVRDGVASADQGFTVSGRDSIPRTPNLGFSDVHDL
jgi:hypothetical protein